MKNLLNKILCWYRHDWYFVKGRWVIEKQFAITERACHRCGLHQEIGQDHVFGCHTLEKEWREVIK